MRNKKIIFYFFSVLCVVSSICFYTWKEKQTEKYLALKASMLENNIQNIAIANSTLLDTTIRFFRYALLKNPMF